MDLLSQLSDEELIAFFRHKKTAMSCIKGLDIFLNQLKDDGLLPTEQHETLKNIKAKQKHVYEFFNSLEEQRPQCIRSFWRCVFQEHMLQKYPALSLLKASLQNGSYKPHMENQTAIKQTENERTKTARKRKNSADETEQMNLETLFRVPSCQNTPAEQPKVCFLREHQSFVNELLEIQKKIPTEKKNAKTTAGKKNTKKEKPDEIPTTELFLENQFVINELKIQEKQKKTLKKENKKNNVKESTETKKIKKVKLAGNPTEQKKQKKTPSQKKENTMKTSTEKKNIKKPKPAKNPTTSFLSKFNLHVNKIEKEKRKKKKRALEIKIKNLMKSAKKKKVTKIKPSQILPSGPGPVRLKCSPKQKKTTIKTKKSAVTCKESADEPKQGLKPEPSAFLIPNPMESAFAEEKKLEMPSVTLIQSPISVTCGDKAGVLHPDKLARAVGEKSILAKDCWFTPSGFEKFGGKMNHKNWKQSIRYENKPVQKLIESGQLQIPPTKKRRAEESKVESKPGSSLSLGPHMFVAQVENQDTDVMKKPKLEVRSQHSDTIMVPDVSSCHQRSCRATEEIVHLCSRESSLPPPPDFSQSLFL